MWRLLSASLLALILALGFGLAPVSAHPMGNFSINHYTAITADGDQLHLLYIVDMAEIPTFQELDGLSTRLGIRDLAANPNNRLTSAERASYLAGMAHALAGGLHASAGGAALPLRLAATDLRFLPGAGGLPTERFYLAFTAQLPHSVAPIAFADTNFPNRAGWKEIVATAASGAGLLASDVPTQDRSLALTLYPSAAISSPPQALTAALTVRPGQPLGLGGGQWALEAIRAVEAGTHPAASGQSTPSQTWAQQRIDALTNLITTKNITGSTLLLSLLVAFSLGAFHALAPGHGKTMVAAYLVGSRGTAGQAVLLGVTVTVTHTVGVFALGLVTLFLSNFIVPDQLYPWLGAVSGLLITLMGGGLFYRRLGTLTRPPAKVVPLHPVDQHPLEDSADVRIRA